MCEWIRGKLEALWIKTLYECSPFHKTGLAYQLQQECYVYAASCWATGAPNTSLLQAALQSYECVHVPWMASEEFAACVVIDVIPLCRTLLPGHATVGLTSMLIGNEPIRWGWLSYLFILSCLPFCFLFIFYPLIHFSLPPQFASLPFCGISVRLPHF